MKRIGLIILALLLSLSTSLLWAEEKKEEKPKSICPKTLMDNSCFDCHIKPSFKLKETKPDAHLDYPNGVKILDGKGYFYIGSITSGGGHKIEEYFNYLRLHKIGHAVIEIYSPGGSLFEAWRIKGLMNEFQDGGGIVETRVRGFAASAGSIVFIAGSKGYRVANPQAELMFHELGVFKGGMFYIELVTPSSAEDEAKTLKHLQSTITSWLATRGKISREELAELIKKKEFWFTGEEAFKFGYVDKLVHGK